MNIPNSVKSIPFMTITPIVVVGILCSNALGKTFADMALYLLLLLLPFAILRPCWLVYVVVWLFGCALCSLTPKEPVVVMEQSSGIFVVENRVSKTDIIVQIVMLDSASVKDSRALLILPLKNSIKTNSGDTIRSVVNLVPVSEAQFSQMKKYRKSGIGYFSKIYPSTIELRSGVELTNKDATLKESVVGGVVGRIDRFLANEQYQGVVMSMLLGDRSALGYETTDKFRRCGLSHFLAISGWHISILFLFLNFFLFLLDRVRYGKYLKSLIVVLVIWSYAALVGFSASVVRAVLMFTLFQYMLFGDLGRKARYNILFGSMFLFVCFNPNVILDIGFQLSYLAVLSIQIFYSRIRNMLYTPILAIDWLLKAVSLFVAVQILVLPIILYYFGFYSMVSIVPNIIFSLLLPVALIGSIAYLVIPLGLLYMAQDWVWSLLFEVLNRFSAMDSWMIYNLYPDVADILIYYLIVLLFVVIFDKDHSFELRRDS